MAKFCTYCGSPLPKDSSFCPGCGSKVEGKGSQESVSYHGTGAESNPMAKSRIAAGLLGIFFGGIGVHNFYLGFNSRGVAQIFVSIFTCGLGSVWGFIEGIMILCGSINADSDGVPLKD